MRPLLLLLALWALGASAVHAQRFVIPLAEDTLLYITNRGTTRILVDLNGTRFKFVADPSELARSQNAFPIPRDGSLTVDIADYMLPGMDTNVIEFVAQGPITSGIDIVLAPVFVEGQTLAYRIEGVEPVPDAVQLTAGPNPSSGPVTVWVTVPASRTAGVPLRLAVYDTRGRLVATLVDEVRYPGTFAETWRPAAASGVYLVRLETDTAATTRAVTVLR